MAEHSIYNFSDLGKSILGKKNIETIVEVGARDCTETLEFTAIFKDAKIYAFECNPETLPICRKAVFKKPNIKLIEKAVSNKEGEVSFFPINKEKTRTTWEDGNPGASSLFMASGKYPVEDYVQDKITVKTTTLNRFMQSYNVKSIDLLWMDIQGAELLALKGARNNIHNIKFMHLEVEFLEIYTGQALYSDVKKYLNRRGFLLISFTNFGVYSADAVFINIRHAPLLKIPEFIFRNLVLFFWKKNKSKIIEKRQKYTNLINGIFNRIKIASHVFFNLTIRPLTAVPTVFRTFSVRDNPFLTTKRVIFFIWLRRVKPLLHFDPNLKQLSRSNIPLDVLIPVTEKDLAVLPYCIQGIRDNLFHPIGTIYLVAPISATMHKASSSLGCKLIDENSVLPITKRDINYKPQGIDRSGWIFQQFLKYSGDKFTSENYYLVMDADTVLTRPQVFIYRNKVVFNHSDEYHIPYFKVYKKLLREKPKYPLSFTSHHILIDKKILINLKKDIERINKKPWYEAILDAIDKDEISSISDYDTYGNYYTNRFKAYHFYWFNLFIPVTQLKNINKHLSRYGNKFKSFSFHTHIKIEK